METRELLRRSGIRHRWLDVTVTEPSSNVDERFAGGPDATAEDERAHDPNHAGCDEYDDESPEIVLRDEHGTGAGPRPHGDPDDGDDRDGRGLRAQTPAAKGAEHESAGDRRRRCRSRGKQDELECLVHGSNR